MAVTLSLVQRPLLDPSQPSGRPLHPHSLCPRGTPLQEQLLPCQSTSPFLLVRRPPRPSSSPVPFFQLHQLVWLHSNRSTCLLQARLPPGASEVVFIQRKGLLIPNRKVIYFFLAFLFPSLHFPYKPEAWGPHVTTFTSRVLRKQMSLCGKLGWWSPQ